MHIKFSVKEGCLVVDLFGELDHHYSEIVRTKIDDRVERDNIKRVILNFENVTFMDSSGIGVVIGRYKKLKCKSGNLCIVNVKDSVNRVFELSGLFKIIDYYDDVPQALKCI